MKIGIYKPFKKVFFVDDSEDNAAWSFEVTNVAKIFAERGHKVIMLSETDLDDANKNQFPNISYNTYDTYWPPMDRVIVFSGSFELSEDDKCVIPKLRAITKRLDFLFTDYRLLPTEMEQLKMFDNIYTQATKHLDILPEGDTYGGVSEFLPYKHKFERTVEEAIAAKSTEFYFGGTERGRLDDFIEYIWRPGHKITTKTQFFDINNRVSREEYMQKLDDAKFSITIADVDYNNNHFITPRPYENYVHDIIGFVDSKYDPDEHHYMHDDYLRVSSYKEMRTKMNEINDNPELHETLLKIQRSKMSEEIISGDYVYDKLK